jgi:hypothetical protein
MVVSRWSLVVGKTTPHRTERRWGIVPRALGKPDSPDPANDQRRTTNDQQRTTNDVTPSHYFRYAGAKSCTMLASFHLHFGPKLELELDLASNRLEMLLA